MFTQSFLVSSQTNKTEPKSYNYLIEPETVDDLITLKGRVLDQSKEGVPFVNIGIRGTLYGTAADNQGYFTLRLPSSLGDQVITISCVGFQSLTLSVRELQRKHQFILDDDISQLADIEVASERITALDVMKKVIKRIPENYLQESYSQLKLHRKKVVSKNGEFFLLEKLEEEYDDNGYQSSAMYGLGKVKSFRTTHQCRVGKLDTLNGEGLQFQNYPQVWRSPTAWSDVVNSRNNNFLSDSKHRKYDFQFNERGLLSKDTIFIDFSIDKPSHRATTAIDAIKFSGTILIDAYSYAVLEVHTTAVLDKEKMLSAKVYRPYANNEEVWWEKEIVKYKKNDGQYFFSSLQRLSNWDLNKKGYIEVIGLGITIGDREIDKNYRWVLQGAYDPEKWNSLIQSNQ